jgi:hypothetical protein
VNDYALAGAALMVEATRCLHTYRCCILVFLVCCLGTGCIPTPYQRDGTGDGYAEFKISEDTYRVTFTGNRSTPRSKIQNYLNYRCAELTITQGHNSLAFTERLMVAADGSLIYATWNNLRPLNQYRVVPTGGLAGALLGGFIKAGIKGAGNSVPSPSRQEPNEPTGGVAQAVIQMFDQPAGDLPQSPDFSDGVVYDARGVMKILQKFDRDLSLMESNRLLYADKLYQGSATPGMEIKRETWRQQLEESRNRQAN